MEAVDLHVFVYVCSMKVVQVDGMDLITCSFSLMLMQDFRSLCDKCDQSFFMMCVLSEIQAHDDDVVQESV